MNIRLYKDESLQINLDAVASGVTTASESVLNVQLGVEEFTVAGNIVLHPNSYDELSPRLRKEAKTSDLSLLFTKKRYDNNYFFHSSENLTIISLYAWEQLTSLPIENGAVYFILSLVRFQLPLAQSHGEITGCIND